MLKNKQTKTECRSHNQNSRFNRSLEFAFPTNSQVMLLLLVRLVQQAVRASGSNILKSSLLLACFNLNNLLHFLDPIRPFSSTAISWSGCLKSGEHEGSCSLGAPLHFIGKRNNKYVNKQENTGCKRCHTQLKQGDVT